MLVTAHRRESFGPPLVRICEALRSIAERNPDVDIVYPVHPNPHVRETVADVLLGVPTVHLIEPQGYREFIQTMRNAHLILTDSGGVQEEAPSLGKPVLVLRETTERPEAIDAGAAILVGTDSETIVAACEKLLRCPKAYEDMATARNPFGDGRASERIVSAIAERLPQSGPPASSREPVGTERR